MLGVGAELSVNTMLAPVLTKDTPPVLTPRLNRSFEEPRLPPTLPALVEPARVPALPSADSLAADDTALASILLKIKTRVKLVCIQHDLVSGRSHFWLTHARSSLSPFFLLEQMHAKKRTGASETKY